MDQLRRTYHRAIHTPLTNVETLWKDYDAFENTLNKLTVRFNAGIHIFQLGKKANWRKSCRIYDGKRSIKRC
jgi:hypothetical protein